MPPLMINNNEMKVKEINDLCKRYLKHTRYDIRCYNTGQNKLQLKCLLDYKIIKEKLFAYKIGFYTNTTASEQPFKMVIKGLAPDTEIDEIKDDLLEQGITSTKITRLKGRQGTPLSMVYVQIPKNEENKQIFSLNRICNVIVTVERLRKNKGITQCYNCQGFHHSSATCHKKTVCVKCSGSHRASECPTKNWGENARCANCDSNHVASYSGCPKYPKPRNNSKQETRTGHPIQDTRPRQETRNTQSAWNTQEPITKKLERQVN